jgi:hypothetical protein
MHIQSQLHTYFSQLYEFAQRECIAGYMYIYSVLAENPAVMDINLSISLPVKLIFFTVKHHCIP